jgi:ubiquinone/menaquinone biosynthesis C-methylase UbiE
MNAGQILDHMAVLADPVRCRMLLVLERNELTVSEICGVLQLPQSTVSRHLKSLSDVEWLTSRRDGTSRFYRMELPALDAGAGQLWPIVREQVAGNAASAQDARRLSGVLAHRRSKSEEFFSSASGQWDHLRAELFGHTFHLHGLLALLDPTLVVGDLGCGTGEVSALVARHVRRVIAVDGSIDMIDAARRRLADAPNVDLRQGDLESLPIESAQLDAAVLALVLHHAPDPARALTEVARVTKKGGRVLVIDMQPHDRMDYQTQMGHVWLGFPEPQLRKLLTTSGFDDVRVHALPVDPVVKGPALFAAVGTRNGLPG